MEIGVDIIEVARIERAIRDEKFVLKVYSEGEREWLRGKAAQSYAGIYAAKEALVKAGGGVLSDYEIGHEESGKPFVRGQDFMVSISHCKEYAVAMAIKN